MAKYYICLDIGGTKVLGVIFNSKREIVYRVKKKTKASGDDSQNIENTIISLVEQLISEYKSSIKDVAAIAAGAPGVINIEKTSLTVGESVRISCTGGGKLTLDSSAPDVATATVDPLDNSSGQIKAFRAGSCIVTATVEDSSNYTYPVKTVTYLVNVQ